MFWFVTMSKDNSVKRNKNRTPKSKYNCGGYALGSFDWYKPYHRICPNFYRATEKDYRICIQAMLKDFSPNLRVIKTMSSLKQGETAIAFRLDGLGDFHYMRKGKNGSWYHKMGGSYPIYRITEYEVFHTAWCDRYSKPIVLFALKEE